MSVSMQSETSKEEIEPEEVELEDMVWNLMSRTGLLSQIQGQISKFIEDNGKPETGYVNPERADGKILGLIFEYLQWIGMKQTNSVLLSESPVEVDLSAFESRDTDDPNYKPELHRLVEDRNLTDEGKYSPSRSHNNYSRDEFEDSKFTSGSGHHSEKSMEIGNDESDQDEHQKTADMEEESLHKDEADTSIQLKVTETNESPMSKGSEEIPAELQLPSYTSTPTKVLRNIQETETGDGSNDMLINFNSPVGKGLDHVRPHVTLRQRFDLDVIPDPFQSPVGAGKSGRMSMGANFPLNVNRSSVSDEGNSGEEIVHDDHHPPALTDVDQSDNREIVEPNIVSKPEDNSPNKSTHEKVDIEGNFKPETKVAEEQKDSLQAASQADEESTSDFMETLTMEDDTQDISIPSDSKGMSSCEHAVSLK